MDKVNAHSIELPALLQAVLHDTLTCSQREKLASICIDLAFAYLTMLRCKGYRIFNRLPEYSEKSLAADGIADLFITCQPGVYPHLKKYLSRFIQDLQTPSDCLMVLRRLCGQRLQQHLRNCFYENDPEGAKLYRNLRLAIKRIKGAVIRKNIMGSMIVYRFAENSPALKRLTLVELERLAQGQCHPAMHVDELVQAILQDAFKAGRLAVAVNMADMYHLIKNFRSTSRSVVVTTPPLGTFPIQWQELHRSMEAILLDIHDTILNRYIREGKLTKSEAVSLYAALCDLAHDLSLGEAAETNYFYIKQHWPLLTEESYYASTRKLYEYLVRILKERLAATSKLIF